MGVTGPRLQPGVDALSSDQANTGSKDRARRGYGAELTISGTRPSQNNYRIDGISVNDYANGGPGSVEGSTLGVDAVQEFSVLTSNYSALPRTRLSFLPTMKVCVRTRALPPRLLSRLLQSAESGPDRAAHLGPPPCAAFHRRTDARRKH
jgi:hypothetical protein